MNNFYVYGHYKPNSDIPFYIGKGNKNRAFKKSNRSKYWNNIVNKHGLKVEIMYQDLTEAQAFDIEKEMIKRYGRANLNCGFLINFTDGGEGSSGLIHSNLSRRKMRKSHKGRVISEETRMKMSIAHKGKSNGWLGKHHSEETKRKISDGGIGRRNSNEVKKKMSMSKMGENNPFFGKSLSKEHKKKISKAKKARHILSKQEFSV